MTISEPGPDIAKLVADADRLMKDDRRGLWEDMPAAQFVSHWNWRDETWDVLERVVKTLPEYHATIAAAVAQETERCAKVAERKAEHYDGGYETLCMEIAATIREGSR